MTVVPAVVAQAAAAFGLDRSGLRPLGGNAGSTWGTARHVLRVGRSPRMAAELAAAAAAAPVLPVPSVIDRAELGAVTAVLLERLPGMTAAVLATTRPALAAAGGRACGAVHAVLAGVSAPPRLRSVPGTPAAWQPRAQGRLLHLDLHPFNVLLGENGELAGVLDWANAAAGAPVLDRARTWSILTLDPAARARRPQPGWLELIRGWTEAGDLGICRPRHAPGRAGSCWQTWPDDTLPATCGPSARHSTGQAPQPKRAGQ